MSTTTSYNPQIAKLLAEISSLTYIQYENSQKDTLYNGSVNPPQGYKQTAIFTAPEIDFGRKIKLLNSRSKFHLPAINPFKLILNDFKALEKISKSIKKVFFGFALEATDGSGDCIMAFRGTQYAYEWVMDANFVQVPVPLIWFKDKKLELAKAHFGFLFLFAFLKEQILKAVENIRNPRICFVTGHSLGAALAVLAALMLATKSFPMGGRSGKIQMYNFAGPRVGDPVFADAYNYFVPFSYRIVNLADIVPILPPKNILNYNYKHIGQPAQEWSYVNQTGDISENHNLQNNYIPALQIPNFVTNKNSGPFSNLKAVIRL